MSQIHDDPICPCHEFSARTPSGASSSAKIPREPENVKTAPTPVYGAAMTISVPTFDQEWQDAPRWVTRYTEQQVAEWWFIRGQHAKEVELLAGMNCDLREMIRVARERVELAQRKGEQS